MRIVLTFFWFGFKYGLKLLAFPIFYNFYIGLLSISSAKLWLRNGLEFLSYKTFKLCNFILDILLTWLSTLFDLNDLANDSTDDLAFSLFVWVGNAYIEFIWGV